MKILLIGHGRMGQLIERRIAAADDLELAGIIDFSTADSLATLGRCAEVVIDFSTPAALPAVCDYCLRTATPLVTGTTGFSDSDLERLDRLSSRVAVLQSANFSLGVAVLARLLVDAAAALEGWDVEIVETHHSGKADAPSGTAKLLLRAIDPEGKKTPVYGREGICGRRPSEQIGIHSLRGGTVAGEHTVGFYGPDEVLTLTHSAASRDIFANGAIRAARALRGLPAGRYGMKDILFLKEAGQ